MPVSLCLGATPFENYTGSQPHLELYTGQLYLSPLPRLSLFRYSVTGYIVTYDPVTSSTFKNLCGGCLYLEESQIIFEPLKQYDPNSMAYLELAGNRIKFFKFVPGAW